MFLILPVWIIGALIFAYQRSFWCDEMVRFGQSLLPLHDGLKWLFGEPAPVAPGELILYCVSKLAFGSFLPPEVWGRLPGILWGAGTLWLALALAKKDKRFCLLPWLVAFSVSLLTVSVQMRPYGSLMFAGALATLMLLEAGKPASILFWPTLFLTHIYGVCFISMMALKEKKWIKFIVGFAFAAYVLSQYHIVPNLDGGRGLPPFLDMIKQILGALSNPAKAMLVTTPLFLLGFVREASESRKRFFWFILLFMASILAPILATLRSGYFFVPRQILGALFPFLTLTALGFNEFEAWLEKKIKNPKSAFAIIFMLCVLATAVPWISTVVMKRHSFPDQPPHKFREIARSLVGPGQRPVLLLNPCDEVSLNYYLTRESGSSKIAFPNQQLEGLNVRKSCWPNGPCLYIIGNMRYCSPDPHDIEKNQPLWRVMNSSQIPFSLVIHDFPKLTIEGANRLATRAW